MPSSDLAIAQQTQTYAGLVVQALHAAGDRTALDGPQGSLSGSAALARLWRIGAALQECTGDPAPTLAILSHNRTDAWLAQVAAMAAGGRVTWLHPRGSAVDHMTVLADSAPRLLLLDSSMPAEVIEPLATGFQAGGGVVASLGSAGLCLGVDLEARATGLSVPAGSLRCQPDGVGLLAYTGGTTGGPKAVARTHGQWAAMARVIVASCELAEGSRFLAVSPLSHVGGTMILPVLLTGGCVRMLGSTTTEGVLHALLEWGATSTLLVPTALDALISLVRERGVRLPALHRLYYGGAPIAPASLRHAREVLGPVLFQVYGQAEGFPLCVMPPTQLDPGLGHRWTSCGRPATGTSIRITAADGTDVPTGEVGELLARGPQVMTGYWRRDDASRSALKGGWLHTGDLARQHADGFVELVGRTRDMIISGGFNVYARDVEMALEAHPAVEAAAVFGTPDARWGEAVTACVVLRASHIATESELAGWVRQHKGPYQVPKRFDFVPALPLTSVGKIDKRALAARLEP